MYMYIWAPGLVALSQKLRSAGVGCRVGDVNPGEWRKDAVREARMYTEWCSRGRVLTCVRASVLAGGLREHTSAPGLIRCLPSGADIQASGSGTV